MADYSNGEPWNANESSLKDSFRKISLRNRHTLSTCLFVLPNAKTASTPAQFCDQIHLFLHSIIPQIFSNKNSQLYPDNLTSFSTPPLPPPSCRMPITTPSNFIALRLRHASLAKGKDVCEFPVAFDFRHEEEPRHHTLHAAAVSRCPSRPNEFARADCSVGRISAVSRRGLLDLHFICFRSGCPLFWHAHMQRAGRVTEISHENAAGFLRNRITACDACPTRSSLLSTAERE